MAHYTEFNNNNYLPWIMYNDSNSVAPPPYAATAQFRTPGVPQNGFTFTSPTQVNTLGTYRRSIQTTSQINSLSAPGVGTSWQHSIPVTMPWVDVKGTMPSRGAGPATIFTGISHSVYADPQSSHSISARAPKRKAVEFPNEVPLSKVYLCADQFANMVISPKEQPNTNSGAAGVQYYAGAQGKGDVEGWQRFREVENRLDLELDEDRDLNMDLNNSVEGGPCIKVADGVLKPVCNSSPILPRKVMEDITKPCMQIVLWKSPAEHIQEVSTEGNHTTASSSTTTTSSIVDSKTYDGQKTDTSSVSPCQDNTMEMSSDTATTFSNPSQHSHHPSSIYSLSQTTVKSPSSSQKVMLSAIGPRNGINTSEDHSILCNADVSDFMDDDMQL